MEIREAESEDAELIAKDFWHPLGKEMENYSELNELKEDADEEAIEEFRKQLEDDKHRIFLLEEGSEEVAFITVKIDERPSRKNGKYLAIINLYVKKGYRGQGYGTKLVEKSRQVAQKENRDYIMVSSEWENERARKFYEKLGFEPKKVKYTESLD